MGLVALLATMPGFVAACAERHHARGLVLHVDPPSATVTISHEAMPDYMDAMVMPFVVRHPSQLGDVKPGDRIRFRLVVRKDRSFIDRLEVVSASPADPGLLPSRRRQLTRVGSIVPSFELTDQHGAPVSLAALRGRVVAVTFLYTRCPLPDYCPRLVGNFKAVRDRFAARLDRDLVLLTVTFDPAYDTVERLRAYAAAVRADTPGWRWLTGSKEAIDRVCESFGVEFWPEEGLITHTLQTAVIDREGRLAATIEGKDYSPNQLGDLIEAVLSR